MGARVNEPGLISAEDYIQELNTNVTKIGLQINDLTDFIQKIVDNIILKNDNSDDPFKNDAYHLLIFIQSFVWSKVNISSFYSIFNNILLDSIKNNFLNDLEKLISVWKAYIEEGKIDFARNHFTMLKEIFPDSKEINNQLKIINN